MSKSRRNKPFDPAKAERERQAQREREAQQESQARADLKNPSAWGLGFDPTLPAHAETETRKDAAGRCTRAWRSNVVNALHRAGSLDQNQVNAANYLANQWAKWKGLEGKPETVGSSQGARELVTDRMIAGGREVNRLLAGITPTSRKLLEAFMVATVEEDRPMVWRGIVQRETGEANEKRQTQLVVAAFEELRREWEGERRAA